MTAHSKIRLADVLTDGARVTVDVALARRILAEAHYSGQRTIDEQHALLLGMELEQGKFMPNTAIVFGELDGELYLLDGRHRMHAVELSGRAIKVAVVRHKVAAREELGDIYCRFDTMVRKRTASQIISATGLSDEGPGGLSRAVAQLLYAATPLLMIGFERVSHAGRAVETRNVDRRLQFARPWKPAAIRYQTCLAATKGRLPGRFRSIGVVAVALATLRYQGDLAGTFWSAAIANDGLRIGDPRRTLWLDLVERSAQSGGEYGLARAAATAWNAFCENRELKQIRIIDAPIRIAGTPFGERAGK